MKILCKELGFQFELPNNWKVIKPDQYHAFSILNSKELPCLFGLAIPSGNEYDVVSILNYQAAGPDFLAELGVQMKSLEYQKEEVLKDIDQEIKNSGDYSVKQTKNIKHIFFKKVMCGNTETICNLINIKTNIGDRSSFQFFITVPNGLIGILTQTLPILKPDFTEKAWQDNPHLEQLMTELIPSIQPVKL